MASDLIEIRSRTGKVTGAIVASALLALGACGLSCTGGATQGKSNKAAGWMNRELTPGQRASMLVASMTQAEKLSMVHGTGDAAANHGVGHIDGIPRLGIPALHLMDGPAGVSQRRTGVTAFPAPLTVAASWDVELVERWAAAMAEEIAGKGNNVHLAPMMNLVRVPQGGRSFEGSGEDPFLTGEMAAATVRGIQGKGIIATAKHFIDNDQEHDRFSISSDIDVRTQHEIYMPPFRASVQAGAGAVMCAFNKINGVFSCENDTALNGWLKRELGFTGFVMSDWYPAVHGTVPAAMGGMDMEMQGGPGTDFHTRLADAVAAGEVTQSRLDDMVVRILTSMFQVGLFDREPGGSPGADVRSAAHTQIARDGALQGTVLLKNASDVLPFGATLQSIAVIGAAASTAPIVVGSGSAEVTPPHVVTPLDGIKARAGSGVAVTYVQGDVAGQAVPTSVLRTPSGQPGLLGQYYGNTTLSGDPALTRTDARVDFDWDAGSPGAGIGAGNWSARWTGTLTPTASGDHLLVLRSDDGSRLLVDGNQVIDNWGDHGDRAVSATMNLSAGHAYAIEIQYYQGGGDDDVHFSWLTPDGLAFGDATAAASQADVAVVVVGTNSGEGNDRADLALPGVQDALVAAVAEANPRTVVVVYAPAQVLMPWADAVAGIFYAWLPGQEAGDALAPLLFGDHNPSGKLPLTMARQTADYPASTRLQYPGIDGRVAYSEGLRVGYRHFDARQIAPLYPFGHGLSYTTFEYAQLSVTPAAPVPDTATVKVEFDVRNSGTRAGAEVAQLYLGLPGGASEPPRQLRCFEKVVLAPGQTEHVTCTLDATAYAFWSAGLDRWVAHPGTYQVMVGSSSRDIRLTGSFEVQGGPLAGTVLEAEQAVLAGGASVHDDHLGFTGTGYVSGASTPGATTTFTVDAAKAGPHQVTLRYANALAERSLGVVVNGGASVETRLPYLGNWEMWDFKTETLELRAGPNTIAFRNLDGDGEIDLDGIIVVFGTGPAPGGDGGVGEVPDEGGSSACSITPAARGRGRAGAPLLLLALLAGALWTRRKVGEGLCLALALQAPQLGCASVNGEDPGNPGNPGNPGTDDGGTPPVAPDAQTDFDDFPTEPTIDLGVPANAPDLFDPPGSAAGGPCLIEPETGTLFPRRWIRPRISFVPVGDQNLFEIRLHAEHQLHDLRVYTTKTSWTMPVDLWDQLNNHFIEQTITVSVRGAHHAGGQLSAPAAGGPAGSLRIAPVEASGSIVYWTTGEQGGGPAFKGFRVGEEIVHTILKAPQADGATCVGCHSSTPDGLYVASSATSPEGGNGGNCHIDLRSIDGTLSRPPYQTPAALELLGRRGQQQPSFSPAHWDTGDRIMVSMFDQGDSQIIWTDLETSSTAEGVGWGVIARAGDGKSAAAATWGRGGELIVYTSSGSVNSGVTADNGGDLYSVLYADRAGGPALPIPGASDPTVTENYATISADERLIGFMRVGFNETSYDNPLGEVFVVPATGGTAQRLVANDPAACSGHVSPGVTNSWPKWSPDALSEGSTRYYWMTFSSKRDRWGTPQLYVAPVTVNEAGAIETYPAIYLWNQPADESNHTPAWDNFGIIVD